jgi:MFS family permease
LRIGHFRNLLIGTSISSLGDQFYFIGLPWIVLQVTGSSWALGTILMAAALPRSALMLVGGAVIGRRMSARQIMIVTAVLRAVLVAAVGALLLTHELHVTHLYILAALFGISDAFVIPAAQAIVPSLVRPSQLPQANSWLQGSLRLTALAGAGPAGWVIKVWGAAWAMFIDAVSFLFIVFALATVPDSLPQKKKEAFRVVSAIAEGLTYVFKDSAMRAFMLLLAVLNFSLTGPVAIGLATLAQKNFASAAIYGLWMSAFATGGLAGTAAAALVHRHRGYLLIAITGILGFSIWAVALLRFRAMAIAAIMLVVGTGIGLVNTSLLAWFQQRVEAQYLGRVSSVLAFCATGLLPLSMLLTGALAQANLMAVFLVSGMCIVTVSIAALASSGVRAIH